MISPPMLLLLLSSIFAQAGHNSTGVFDKPLEIVRDFGPSPYYAATYHVRKKLTCYIYPTFMVKEYDEGQKGAEWLSILQFEPSNRPSCSLSHLSGEKIIQFEEWIGYFKGAKDSFAFFDACDGTDEGLPFVVYDTRTGRKIFEDSAYLWSGNYAPASVKSFHIGHDDKQRLVLRYLRVVSADCDLTKDGAACWNQLSAKLGITVSKPPICQGYEHAKEKLTSALGYPVSVVLSEPPQVNAVDGPIFCWPVD